MMKIILLGYMGIGKSTIGKLLSTKMDLFFIDLDEYIEMKESQSISEIFATKGEIYFRKKEHQYLQELLNSKKSFVLSLGGGTPCYAGNMDAILQTNTNSIYLSASISLLVERLIKQKENRPLIAQLPDNKLTEFVAKHLFERRSFYEQATHQVICDNKSITELVAEIKCLIH